MRTFFIILGAGSVVYGGYLLMRRAKCRRQGAPASSPAAGSMTIDPGSVIIGPTSGSGNEMPVDNNISIVEHYGSGLDKFPPTTYIGIPVGEAAAVDYDSIYQPIKF
jgi:hypothetical protein